MASFADTLDKLNGALRKIRDVMRTDVTAIFVPGRPINEQFLTEMEERFRAAGFGVWNTEEIISEVRERWWQGKIKDAKDAEAVVRELLAGK